ncbi:MAG: tRNA (adenosine(37)-N6)-threonylcarbamoyltransferase complex ATPase subunit type 1 TsaE [Tannerellaceae bacterium]|jgi:tRNA threonylcarbamoyladenosine biosynthesis protein TsaE|nr:tRNA (adenosine(37)-N6)-threonylcarbamoyltransferase complex ATPase subunit type 1 TsaE [Tannerellaceae bacterium]
MNTEEERNAAQHFIQKMNGKKVFAFHGKMGAGKTTFIKAVCKLLGVEEVVNSPTFSIINEYHIEKTGETVYHFDFYRISNPEEAEDLGLEDFFYSGKLCFIEWPEKIGNCLPDGTSHIDITENPDGSRSILIH